jgi:heptosyltransferase-1
MRRILFVKTSSLGDVVHHLPALSDAARAFPDAEIDWVVEQPFAELPPLHPRVRRVIPVAVRRWRRAPWRRDVWREIGAFRQAAGLQSYDAVVDSQGLLKSALLGAAAHGVRHGMDFASAREPLAACFYDVRHGVPKGLHAVARNRALCAAALGYTVEGPPDYGLRVTAPVPLALPGRYAVFLTMSSRAAKLWPQAHWVELARALGMHVVLPWGSEPERLAAEAIAAAAGDATVPPRLSLSQLGALLAGAQRVAGVDTGLTHLAVAVGAPTVGIYCGSAPALTGLYGAARARNVGGRGASPGVREVMDAFP